MCNGARVLACDAHVPAGKKGYILGGGRGCRLTSTRSWLVLGRRTCPHPTSASCTSQALALPWGSHLPGSGAWAGGGEGDGLPAARDEQRWIPTACEGQRARSLPARPEAAEMGGELRWRGVRSPSACLLPHGSSLGSGIPLPP